MASIYSDITQGLVGQPMFQILSQAKLLETQGRSIIHLEIGDPDFPSPVGVIESAKRSLDAGHTKYVQSSGLPELKDACSKITYKSRGFQPSHDQLLITSGANIQIYLAVLALVNPGDEVIIPDPGFVSYESIIKACRGVPVKVACVEEEKFRLSASAIAKAISTKTKLIIVNSPNNPTGAVLSEETFRDIFTLCQKYNIHLLSDEVYGRMIYDDAENSFFSPSFFDKCLERTLIVHSLSKTYAMTGWRIGAVTGPQEIISKMSILYETITSCTPPFIQRAAISALKLENDYTYKMLNEYQKRRDLILDEINRIDSVNCIKPDGAFYAFMSVKMLNPDSVSFCNELLNYAGVAACPGVYFGQQGEGYVRLCFANSLENIEEGMNRLSSFVKGY